MNLNATLLGEMFTFAIFVWFTMRFVMPPLQQAIADRQAQAQATEANNIASEKKLAKADATAAATEQTALESAKAIKAEAKASGKQIIADAEVAAKERAMKIIRDSEQQVQLHKTQMLAELKAKFASDLVLKSVESILRKQVSDELNQVIVDQAITEEG